MSNNTKTKNHPNSLPVKVFAERKSLITELLEVKHFVIMKHMFLALLLGFLARDFTRVLTNERGVNFGLKLIRYSFKNFHLAVVLWLVLFGINLLPYFCFKYWVRNRIKLSPKSLFIKLWDLVFVAAVILYDAILLSIIPLVGVRYLELGIASMLAIALENIRLLMKSHAFIRSNAPEVLNYKPHSDESFDLPSFSNYIYFSFAPTLLYRKEYPRTSHINIRNVVVHFTEVLLLIWLQSYIFEMFFVKPFKDVGKSEINWKNIVVIMVGNTLAGGLEMLINFYLVLHAWLNGFAELLRFGDRWFYEDWWTSTNFSTYFRNWNLVVHEWLYEYIYKDFYYYIVPNNKTVAKVMVFLISALAHEYAIITMSGHFLPVLFVFFFCFGGGFTSWKTKHPLFNVFFLYALALGNSIQISLHVVEYFARVNCPYSNNGNTSKLLPRLTALDCNNNSF